MSSQALTSNDGRINYLGVDQILFDYIVNYVFPQYTLPWNNFYTNIDAEPFYQRNEQRNTNAVLAKTPRAVDAKPEIVIVSGIRVPNWSSTVQSDSTGSVIDTVAQKTLLGRVYSKHYSGLDFQYIYRGAFVGVRSNLRSELGDSKWIVFHLNLLNQSPRNKQSVVIVTDKSLCDACDKAVYSSLTGNIAIDDNRPIIIKNPIPLGNDDKDLKIEELVRTGASNTVYNLYGNRIFIAIKTDELMDLRSSKIAYDLAFRIAETPTLASTLNAAATP